MEEIIKEKYDIALRGREIWLDYKKKYDIDDNWCLIIFPSAGIRLDNKTCMYLKEYLDRKYLKHALVLYACEVDVNQTYESIQFVKIKDGDLESVICYYKLLQFHNNIVVMSLEEPFGNCHIIGQKGITLDDYIQCGLLV